MALLSTNNTLLYQSVELLMAAVVGVILYSLLLWAMKKQRSLRWVTLFEPTAQAIAAGIIGFSCFAMVYPHLPNTIALDVSTTHEGLYIIAGVVAGIGLVEQVHYFFGEASSSAATIAMLAHGTAEGMGLGLLVGSPGFQTIFKSQVIHGVPDGMLVAMISLERSGFVKTIISALTARLGFVAVFYATVKYMPPVSNVALWSSEGVAIGSMVAMAWEELIEPAVRVLGKTKAFTIITVTTILCFYAFD